MALRSLLNLLSFFTQSKAKESKAYTQGAAKPRLVCYNVLLLLFTNMHLDKTQKSRHIKVIFFTLLLDMIGVGILIPIIPYIFDPASHYYLLGNYNVSQAYLWQGIAMAVFPICQFFFAPMLGELSDVYGRKRVIIVSLFGTMIGFVLTAIAILHGNIWLFLLGRAIDGATAGNISTAMASISDVTEEKDRAKNFGMIGAAFGLGFIIGPALGGILAKAFTYATPFYFSALLSLLDIVMVYIFMQETLSSYSFETKKSTTYSNVSLHPLAGAHNVIKAFKDKLLRNIFIITFIFNAGFAFYTTFAGVYMKERFHLDLDHTGYYFAYVGVFIVIAQAIGVRKIMKVWQPKKALNIGLFTLVFVFVGYVLSQTLYLNLILVPLFAVAFAIANASISAITSKKAPEKQGLIMGISASVVAMATAIPQLLAGLLASSLGYVAPLCATVALMLLTTYFVRREV